jgi:hypothetical protein
MNSYESFREDAKDVLAAGHVLARGLGSLAWGLIKYLAMLACVGAVFALALHFREYLP